MHLKIHTLRKIFRYTFQEFQKPKSTDSRKQLYLSYMLAKQASCNVHTYSYICTKIIINCSLFVYNLITVLAGGTGRGSMVRKACTHCGCVRGFCEWHNGAFTMAVGVTQWCRHRVKVAASHWSSSRPHRQCSAHLLPPAPPLPREPRPACNSTPRRPRRRRCTLSCTTTRTHHSPDHRSLNHQIPPKNTLLVLFLAYPNTISHDTRRDRRHRF